MVTTKEVQIPKQSEELTNLAEILGEYELEKQCALIANWLKLYFRVSGSAFFLQDSRLSQQFLYRDNVHEDIIHNLQGTLPHLHQAVGNNNEPVYFVIRDGNLAIIKEPASEKSPQDVILAAVLSNQDHPLGVVALLVRPETVKFLVDEEHNSCWFTPLISSLLDNAISHEEKNRKLNRLNLYQTVSSSLAYVGDLYELLTTIMSIVTSELRCEEGSILFYDEEHNELEFFTAVGETGKDLETDRFPADKGIAGRALRELTTQIVNEVESSPDFYGDIDEEHSFKTKSILATPLVSGEEIVGVIEAINKIEGQFDKEDGQILAAIADEVALAVKHTRLFEYVVDSYCKIRQGKGSCKNCKRPLKSWTPCAVRIGKIQ
jgi:putative methionine-R-sulfoxide reductase with GAF domain